MTEKSTKACLRIFTSERDVDFIYNCLQVKPTSTHLKGEAISLRNPEAGLLKQSSWIYQSGLDESRTITEHIDFLLQVLESPKADILTLMTKVTDMDLFCFFSSDTGQGSVEVSTALIKRLARFDLHIILDIYS